MDRLRAIIATLVILSASAWSGSLTATTSGGMQFAPIQEGQTVGRSPAPAGGHLAPSGVQGATQVGDASMLMRAPLTHSMVAVNAALAGPSQPERDAGTGAAQPQLADDAQARGSPVQTRVDRSMFGINVATWDYQMVDPSTIPTIRALGAGVQQFPNFDVWNWHTDIARDGSANYSKWANFKEPLSLSGWSQILGETGTSGLFIVPYGFNPSWTGGETVADVEALTHYIVDHHMPVTAMVIGSEEYGSWAFSLRQDRSAAEYAKVAAEMAQAIHAIDPRMLVGVDVITPNPGGQSASDLNWNETVLKTDAPYIQFVSEHSYLVRQKVTDAALLSAMTQIPVIAQISRQELNQYAEAYARHIQIWITEFNPYASPTAQSVQPVYGAVLAESMLLWLSSGVTQVDWWSLHGDAHFINQQGTSDPRVDLVPGTPYALFSLASEGFPPQPRPINTLFPSGVMYARLTAAIGGGAHLTTWPTLLSRSGLFLAKIQDKSRTTWVAVNNTASSQVLRLGGQTLTVPGAAAVVEPASR